MKTLIIALYPYNGQGLDSWIDHGAGMTYTAAKIAGCDVSFLDMKTLHSDEELQKAIKGYDLISFGLKSSYYPIAIKIINFAKQQGSKVLVGGYHATAAPNELLENPLIDYIFHGESEITFPHFLKSPNSFKREIFGEKPQDLDSLPFMDRSIYRDSVENCLGWWHGNKLSKMVTVMAARGCPYRCAFCQPLEDNHFGKKLRRRSVDSLISELKILKETYNPECVMIHDDTFLIQPKWLEEFIDKYPQINLPFWASGRADGICEHPDIVKRLIKVGWELVSVGFESGSQRILDLLKKGTTVEQNLEAARIVHSFGAKLYANYMTAIPWETKWDIQATHKMADQINAEMPSWAYFTPYPGCEWGEKLINRGWSLLDRNHYDRCPSGVKSKHVDYDYVTKVREGFREDPYPTFTDIIIPGYNNKDYTVNCIKSIEQCTEPGKYRVIYIDNNSDEDCINAIKDALKPIDHLYIQMPKNEGFVGAINAGLEKSDAPNVCLLNNDTIVSPNWLSKLTSTLGNNPDLGIVGALTFYGKGTAVDSHHSLTLHKTLLPQDAPMWSLEEINKGLEERYSGRTSPTAFVAFLCAVIKREVIHKVGHLDPNFAMGMWDDLDYNRSVWSAGYRTELAIDTCIKHFGRSTFNKIQKELDFDVDTLLATNKAYLDRKWNSSSPAIPKKGEEDKILIISRAIYTHMGDRDDLGILTKKRLSLMQRYFINSLKNQTNQDFEIYLVVGKETDEPTKRIKMLDWGNLNINFIHSQEDLSIWIDSVRRSKKYSREIDVGCPEYIVKNSGHQKSSIMARLDTDDWVAPGWIAHIKHCYNILPGTHYLLNYQVTGQDIDGRLYNLSRMHHQGYTSPFIVLVQKNNQRLSPYECMHLHMGSKFANVYTIPPAYCYMVLHGSNRGNKFYKEDIYIDPDISQDKIIAIDKTKKVYNINRPSGSDWRSRIAQSKVN